MGSRITSTFKHNVPEWDVPEITLVDQVGILLISLPGFLTLSLKTISVFRGVFDRIDASPAMLSTPVDVGNLDIAVTVQHLTQFLNRSANNNKAFHIKTKFCYMLNSLFAKKGRLSLRKEVPLRNILLEIVSGWTSDNFPVRSTPLT